MKLSDNTKLGLGGVSVGLVAVAMIAVLTFWGQDRAYQRGYVEGVNDVLKANEYVYRRWLQVHPEAEWLPPESSYLSEPEVFIDTLDVDWDTIPFNEPILDVMYQYMPSCSCWVLVYRHGPPYPRFLYRASGIWIE